jgi:hypothetical protein
MFAAVWFYEMFRWLFLWVLLRVVILAILSSFFTQNPFDKIFNDILIAALITGPNDVQLSNCSICAIVKPCKVIKLQIIFGSFL